MNKKWLFERDGKEEEIALEKWIWGVVYDDGTELHQFDDAGRFHQIGEVDQSRVTMFVLYQPKGVGDGRIDILIPQGKEISLVHKYKHYIFDAGTQSEHRAKVYCIGYKLKGGHTHMNYIMPNGAIVQGFGENDVQLSQFGL